MAMCVMAAVGLGPCQCFSLGENQTTSPGRISSIGPPQRCAKPQPALTMRVWPSGCVCQAVRAPGSKVTLALNQRWIRGLKKLINPYGACEPLCRPLSGRLRANSSDVHFIQLLPLQRPLLCSMCSGHQAPCTASRRREPDRIARSGRPSRAPKQLSSVHPG